MSLVAWTVTHLSEYFLKMNKKVSSTGMYIVTILPLSKIKIYLPSKGYNRGDFNTCSSSFLAASNNQHTYSTIP